MVEAGAVAEAKAARTMEKANSSLSDPDHLHTVALQYGELEELAGGEGDKGQGNVRQEVGAVNDPLGHQIQTVGPDQDPGQNIGGDVW